MAEKISPEERLFEVIQESKKLPSGIKDFKKKKIKISLRGIEQFFVNLMLKAATKEEPEMPGVKSVARVALSIKLREMNPKLIDKALIIVLAVLIVLVINSAVTKKPSIAKIVDAISLIRFQATNKTIENFKPITSYLEEIKKRDIFKPLARVEKKAAVIPRTEDARIKLKEMVKDLKIVGISWGKSSKAMIRSEKEKNTYFLRQGQIIGTTGIEIKTILKDKIVISYEGEETELL